MFGKTTETDALANRLARLERALTALEDMERSLAALHDQDMKRLQHRIEILEGPALPFFRIEPTAYPLHQGFHPVAVGTIGWAVDQLVHGLKVRRRGWNGKGMFLQYEPAKESISARSPNTLETTRYLPFIWMKTAGVGEYVPWLCSQTDLLADDYELAE